jgi:putative transposase
LWDVRASKKALIAEGRPSTNEALIFKSIDSMRQVVDSEAELTKSARRVAQKKKEWEKARAKSPGAPPKVTAIAEPMQSMDFDETELLDGIRESDD